MPSLSSETDIMNEAMDHLGEEVILSGEIDDRPAVLFMKRNYARSRDALLEMAYWRFARRRATLAQNATAPAFGWLYSYRLPTDFLRIIPPEVENVPFQFEIEGSNLLTNTPTPLQARYIARVTDPKTFSSLFAQALALNLAMRAAHAVTGKQSYREALKADFREALLNAQLVDGMTGEAAPVYGDEAWLDARYAGA